MAAAVDLLRDLDARIAPANVERAYTLGPVDLVRGQGHDIDVVGEDVDRDLAHRLHAIGVEDHAALMAEGADLADGLDDADLVVRVHDRDQDGLVSHRGLQILERDQPVGLDGQVGDPVAGLLQPLAGIEHRLVLGHLGDDVVAALLVHLGNALERQVVRLGGAGGKDNLLGGRADQLRDLLARALDTLLRLPAKPVIAAGGVTELAGKVGQHRVEHARVKRGSRVVVHVDGQLQLPRGIGLDDCVLRDDGVSGYDCRAHGVLSPPAVVVRSAGQIRLRC